MHDRCSSTICSRGWNERRTLHRRRNRTWIQPDVQLARPSLQAEVMAGLSLPSVPCVTLGKCLNLSVLRFLLEYSGTVTVSTSQGHREDIHTYSPPHERHSNVIIRDCKTKIQYVALPPPQHTCVQDATLSQTGIAQTLQPGVQSPN